QVSGLRMTYDPADALINKWLDRAWKRISLALGIVVNENNNPITRRSQPTLELARFSIIFLQHQTKARFALRDAVNFPSGLITRTVVHNHHFDFALVVRGKKRA